MWFSGLLKENVSGMEVVEDCHVLASLFSKVVNCLALDQGMTISNSSGECGSSWATVCLEKAATAISAECCMALLRQDSRVRWVVKCT